VVFVLYFLSANASWTIDDNGEPGKADQIIALVIQANGVGGPGTGDIVLNLNPLHLGVTNSSSSGVWTGQSYVGDTEPWLDLESGNHQWTPHPFKAHGPKNTNPCDPIP